MVSRKKADFMKYRIEVGDPDMTSQEVIEDILLDIIDALADEPEEPQPEPSEKSFAQLLDDWKPPLLQIHNCVDCAHNFTPHRKTKTPESQPDPILWKKGDFAQWTGRDGASGLVEMLRVSTNEPLYVVRPPDEDISFSAYTNKLSTPTRSQLATEIGTDEDGKPILAWAWEGERSPLASGMASYFQSGYDHPTIAPIRLVEAAGIPIITANQCARHWPDGFPPKE